MEVVELKYLDITKKNSIQANYVMLLENLEIKIIYDKFKTVVPVTQNNSLLFH